MTYQINQPVTFEVRQGSKWVSGYGRVAILMYGADDARIVGRAGGKRVQFDVLHCGGIRNIAKA